MGHQRYEFGFTGEASPSHDEDRFSPQNEADYERLGRIAAAEAAGIDVFLDVRSVELYAHISRRTVYCLVSQGKNPSTRIGRYIRVSKRAGRRAGPGDRCGVTCPRRASWRPASRDPSQKTSHRRRNTAGGQIGSTRASTAD